MDDGIHKNYSVVPHGNQSKDVTGHTIYFETGSYHNQADKNSIQCHFFLLKTKKTHKYMCIQMNTLQNM